MLTLCDYGLGNVRAFANIYKRLNVPLKIARTPNELDGATRLVLPGVGAFDWAMTRLDESGLRGRLDELVLGAGVPVLGICVGMQMMARRSDEGARPGLGWIDAEVRRFDEASMTGKTRLPHMGWNEVVPVEHGTLFAGLDAPSYYFLHSYYLVVSDAALVLGKTDYHGEFVSAVRYKRIFGVQFHPEKSHHWGVQLLRNFAEI